MASGPTTPPGGPDENPQAQKSKHSLLMRSYISNKLKSKSDRLSFAKKIQSSKTVPDNIIADIEAYKGMKSEFSGVDVTSETMSIAELQRELASFLVGIESQKTALRSIFLQEYDISAGDYTKYIASKIDNISTEQGLQELHDSDIQRDKFLEGIYKKKTPKRKLFSNVLKNMNLEDRFDQLEDHLKTQFMEVVSKFGRRQQLEKSDIMVLFESSILKREEKQKIIEAFMPSISIDDALKLNILNTSDVTSIKKQALKRSLDVGMLGGINLDVYIEGINNKELVLSTQGLFQSKDSQEKLFEQNFFFDKFQQDFSAMLKKIEDDLAAQSIQTAGEMQEILSGIEYVKGIENFQAGSTMVIKQSQKDPSGNMQEVTLYAEIISLASAGTFIIAERGVDEYTRDVDQTSRQTYSQFIDYVTKDNIPTSVDFITSKTLDHKIRTGEIKDVNGAGTFEDRSELSKEIKDITQEIEKRKKELRKNGVPKTQWGTDQKLQDLYKIQDEKNALRDGLEHGNKETLQQKIDKIDPSGEKFGLEVGTNFVTKGGNGDIYSITSIDTVNQSVTLRGLKGDETLSYTEFMTSFEDHKTSRVSKIDTFEELFSQSDDVYKSWQGFEYKNGKVRNKSSKLNIDYNYLVPDKDSDQELIKIHEIDDTMVTISFGEAKSNNKKKKNGDKIEGEIFSTEKKEYRVTIGVLDHYIKENKLSFRSLEEGKITEEEKNSIPKPEEKFGFGNWFFQGMSISAAIQGSKTAVEQITNMLNEGDEDKANQFALTMFGPLLGKDGKTELMSRVEQTEKKSMEEFIQRLKDINSYPATQLIESWMLDPRAPQYKKEAGMFYMFEKYGALCAKSMYKYQGQYFWYQQMGGRIGDSVWVETHAKNNRDPKQNTTEEQLVYNLMSEQVKDGGYGGIKRRSKLAKELKAMRGKGKEEEYDTGVKDGSNERDLQDRLDGGLSELSSGNYPNAFGWLETIVNKGGSMKDMNMIPFVTVFSGMAYNFEKDILDKIKNFPGDSRMLMMLRFMSYSGDIDLLNDTIMEICTRLDDRGYPGILSKASTIFKMQKDKTIPESKKQKLTIAFYEEYGEVLTNSLYMLNSGKEDDVHNKMIFFEKDSCDAFGRYYSKMEGYVNADGDFGKNEGLMADAFAGAGTSGIDIYRATKQLLELRTGGAWAKHEAGPHMWKEIMHEFEAIPKRKYDSDPNINRQKQEQLLESNLRKFLSAIVSLNTDTRVSSSYNAPTGFFNRLNDWGVYFDDLVDAGANAEEIKGGGHKELIQGFVQNIISYSNGGSSKKRPTTSDGNGGFKYVNKGENAGEDTASVSNLIQGKTNNIIQKPSSQGVPVSPSINTDTKNNDDSDDSSSDDGSIFSGFGDGGDD